jgi:hypothetical protein
MTRFNRHIETDTQHAKYFWKREMFGSKVVEKLNIFAQCHKSPPPPPRFTLVLREHKKLACINWKSRIDNRAVEAELSHCAYMS